MTVGPAMPFGQYLIISGASFLVLGGALLLFGRRGNIGLPVVGVGILSLAIGVVASVTRRR